MVMSEQVWIRSGSRPGCLLHNGGATFDNLVVRSLSATPPGGLMLDSPMDNEVREMTVPSAQIEAQAETPLAHRIDIPPPLIFDSPAEWSSVTEFPMDDGASAGGSAS